MSLMFEYLRKCKNLRANPYSMSRVKMWITKFFKNKPIPTDFCFDNHLAI